MKYAVFPGSFKPPHIGHLKVVEKMLPEVDKFYIIISNKPRGIFPPFNKKLIQFNKEELNKTCKKFKVKPCDKKEIDKKMKNEKIPNISAKQSYEIWNLYKELLPIKQREKLKIIIARHSSPVIFSFIILNNLLKKGDILYLLKSEKDKNDNRFSIFKKETGIKLKEVLIPNFKGFSSYEMRKAIANNNKKLFEEFLPNKVDKEKIWKILSF